jgi:hypothetical protein
MVHRLTGIETFASSRRYVSSGRGALVHALAQNTRLGVTDTAPVRRAPLLEGKPRTRPELVEGIGSDSLPGLANRNAIMERMRPALATARRKGHSVALILADIDYFQQINDAFGHAIGGAVLQ